MHVLFSESLIYFLSFICFSHFYLDYFRVLIEVKYIESLYLVLEEKRRDIVFDFQWCVMHGARFQISSMYTFVLIFDLEN